MNNNTTNLVALIKITVEAVDATRYPTLTGGDVLNHWADGQISRHGRYDDPLAEARKRWDESKDCAWNKAKRP